MFGDLRENETNSDLICLPVTESQVCLPVAPKANTQETSVYGKGM